MIPTELVLTSSEMQYVNDNIELIRSLGFDYSVFGQHSILIREIPILISECDIKDAFKALLDDMQNEKKDKVYTALYSLACKAAVKANRKLDE